MAFLGFLADEIVKTDVGVDKRDGVRHPDVGAHIVSNASSQNSLVLVNIDVDMRNVVNS